MAQANRGSGGDHRERHAKPSLWEWVVAVAGAALVLFALGFMVYEAFTFGSRPTPQITVRVDTVVAYRSGYTVAYRATNEGDVTASSLLVRGELRDGDVVVEQSESTIDFVPARSWRPGGLVFRNDPRRYRMDIRPVGFDKP